MFSSYFYHITALVTLVTFLQVRCYPVNDSGNHCWSSCLCRNQGFVIIWACFPNISCKLPIKAPHFRPTQSYKWHPAKPASPTPTRMFYPGCISTKQSTWIHLTRPRMHACALMQPHGFGRRVSPFRTVLGGVWLPNGSWTVEHLSLNNLRPLSRLNNSETLLISGKIIAVILRWKRSRVGLWGSDWFGASRCPCR